ncbi:MAG: Hpt domain-containing protein, partial [Deltaproteobacteria bacterium]|nr:Hpt domain-containing protein [Deltaproteobacteria bacterium]
MEISREDILREFEVEAEEHLDGMEQSLIALDRDRCNEDLQRSLFRSAHTLKGAAACVGFTAMTQYAHALEDLLEQLWQQTIPVTDELISHLLKAVDEWRVMVPAAMSGTDELSGTQVSILGILSRFATDNQVAEPTAKQIVPTPIVNTSSETNNTSYVYTNRRRTLRVSVNELDRLVNLTGEIAIARSRISNLLINEMQSLENIRDAHLESERLYLELQEQVMRLRMVPVGQTFRQHIRTVRDVAVTRGKQAQLIIKGEDVEVDMAVLESLRDPLTHLVRNAVDHGIETPAIRYEKNKNVVGTIQLRAHYESGSVEIIISDDGAGLDHNRILVKARKQGLIAEDAKPSDDEILHYIFAPGFSTAAEVTEISGRGIGLDIVERNIESLHGVISI